MAAGLEACGSRYLLPRFIFLFRSCTVAAAMAALTSDRSDPAKRSRGSAMNRSSSSSEALQPQHRRLRAEASSSSAVAVTTPSARLTFAELAQRGDAQDVPVETFSRDLPRGIREPTHLTVLPSHEAAPASRFPRVYLVRADQPNRFATQAYARIEKPSISLNHRPPGWGRIMFGVIYKRVGDPSTSHTYQAPTEKEAQYVAIKQLSRRVVKKCLDKGYQEDPYKEIARMQEFGDNVHVLSCLDALLDDEYIYIVTPKGETLKDMIPWESPNLLPLDRVHRYFVKIVQILAYLERRGIAHRDLSPDNLLLLPPHDNLVAFDLALSHRLPTQPDSPHAERALGNPFGNFGTYAWMAPEIYANRVFCGAFGDLWSAGILLWNMHTNLTLYELPIYGNICFRFFIMARGLSSDPLNERAMEVLQQVFGLGRPVDMSNQRSLMARTDVRWRISPEALELLSNILMFDPCQRWTLAQVLESDYVRGRSA